ncbi:hypothetical protein SAMN06265348_10842 [Pedobacter westerhofensis]|uniref:DUF983 domain-containing protein n=1 Tax=Pedobacter westerhofensis TaxID=425512 RepID=A0A521EF95_9SPHI|nr:DUF983 domain-containing protein [Pedobacter westerhofensis]SMO82555.1 hypothetical protein SAMN06265348_10842 [Pedobacter westerhofensis]
MEKTSKLYAIVHGKCPHCRRGDIFRGSLYGFDIQHTNEICGHCGQRFEIEPGYFYAAMYVSYAMNVIQMITTGIATYILSGGNLDFDSLWLYVGVIFGMSFILSPFNYRYSRVILLHWLSPKISYNAYYDTP